MRRLVFVHGRAQEFKDALTLKGVWVDTLRQGLAKSGLQLPNDLDIKFPYYGQTLVDLLAPMGPVAEVVIRGATADAGHKAFTDAILSEIRANMGISDAEVTALHDPNVVQKGALNWSWVLASLRAIDEHVPGSGVTLGLFTYDVYQYLKNARVRKAIDAGIQQAIARDVPTVVVGHSLGSVVAYRLLADVGTGAGWQVPLYVTVGSPLAIEAIKSALGRFAHPACVDAWFNARDPSDCVALYPLDDAHFRVDPKIRNKSDVANHTDNHHGIIGYLDDAQVARTIYDALMG
jgi:hypothetical protein